MVDQCELASSNSDCRCIGAGLPVTTDSDFRTGLTEAERAGIDNKNILISEGRRGFVKVTAKQWHRAKPCSSIPRTLAGVAQPLGRKLSDARSVDSDETKARPKHKDSNTDGDRGSDHHRRANDDSGGDQYQLRKGQAEHQAGGIDRRKSVEPRLLTFVRC